MAKPDLCRMFGFDSFLKGSYPKTRVGPMVGITEESIIIKAFDEIGIYATIDTGVNGTGQLRFLRGCSPEDVRMAQNIIDNQHK